MVKFTIMFVFFYIITAALIWNTVSSATIKEQKPGTIQLVAAIFRHGDRSPTQSYPNDPHINFNWPGGFGALSQKGALQHFNLGQKLRARYHQLLPKDGQYTKDEISVLSSYAERCLMSAQSLLAGFMPPLKNKNLLPINWQPVPVTSIPSHMDHLLSQHKPCRKYDDLLKSLKSTNLPKDLKKLNEDNQDLYKHLTKYSGKNITTSSDIRRLYDTLLVEQNMGLILPDWTKNVFPESMISFVERDYAMITETPYMKKIKGGVFITEVLKHMSDKKMNTLQPNRKVFLYSAHDLTLLNVMNAIGIVEQTARLPDYASTLIFELHKNPNFGDNFEVKIFYYSNSEMEEPKEISIPNCVRPCFLTSFTETVEHLLFNNFDEICENVPSV